jgi:uncharacterized protein (DUF2252 family)
VKERQAAGRSLAKQTPLKEHGIWAAASRKHDPVDLLTADSKARTAELLPIRYGRMLANPFAFLRGSAAVMAADLSRTAATGVQVQACGDHHLANFGGFATPERRVVFDINDFDETSHAPWEWDVKQVVGVGSVGTVCGILLLQSGAGEPLFLQFKEAGPSVLEPYTGASPYAHDGERVVRGQRLMQSASDMFLGWLTGTGEGHRSFYIRQLNDVKLKPQPELATPANAKIFARYTGRALARAHCRSGDPVLLSGYMGDSEAFEDAMADFAVAYADQAERDHQALVAAVRAGRVEARMGM